MKVIIEELKLEGVRIVEYKTRYASGIARMWNESSEGWNGEEWDMTPEKVLNEESCSDYIALYLVVNNQDEVLGYCKIEEYNDAKSVYIPMLNVHPRCHGRKYGKALVLKTLKMVTEKGYERLDLHSWAGNKKAVPFYKKMGFRWQTNRRGVYMMNYLPLLLNLEILQPYFKNIDWYHDLYSDLSLEPDSVMEKGFEIIKYRWEKGSKFVEAVFNIESKGMHRLACNDFELLLSADKKDLFYGKRDVVLKIKARNPELPAKISVLGRGAIKAHEEVTLKWKDGVQKISLEVMDEKVDDKKNALEVNTLLADKKIPLKLGINPKPPVEACLKAEKKMFRPGQCIVYLQLVNNLAGSAIVRAEFKSLPELEFTQKNICCELKGKEKMAIPLSCYFHKGLYYDEKIELNVVSNAENNQYRQRLRCLIPDKDTVIYGEKENSWFIHKGNIHLKYGKDRTFAPCYLEIEDADFWFFYRNPKLSEPFAKEFNNQKPEKVEFEKTGDDVLMKARFTSRNKKIRVFHHLLFRHDDCLTGKWEICNLSKETLKIDQVESCFDLAATHDGYDGNVIEMSPRDRDNYFLGLTEEKKMPGWDYYQANGMNAAFVRDEKLKHSTGEFWQRIFYDFGEIAPGESRFIGNEELFLNHFSNWKKFYRWYYGNENYPAVKKLQQLTINDGNPFADDISKLHYEDISHTAGKKNLELFSGQRLLEKITYTPGKIAREIPSAKVVRVVSSSDSVINEVSQTLFRKADKKAEFKKIRHDSKAVQVLHSELLDLKADNDFLNGIFSLKYQGLEIFSTSFPQALPKGWENNWKGGLTIKPLDISDTVLDNHTYKMNLVSRIDNYGNSWPGFSFSCRYNDQVPHYDGVKVKYNYLLSPSHDILAAFPEVICSGGKFIPHLRFACSFYLNELNKMKFYTGSSILRISDKMAGMSELTVSHIELTEKKIFINCLAQERKLHLSLQCQMGAVVAAQEINNIRPEQTIAASPFIIAFNKEKLCEDDLMSLRNLHWR